MSIWGVDHSTTNEEEENLIGYSAKDIWGQSKNSMLTLWQFEAISN